ncbi:MAG: CoA transferase, partial [Acetobacteraceae bacterium]|nr:CoA transferase [Acetobacteraceae bacterium]
MPGVGPSWKLRVLEASTGVAGAYCGWLLQQVGAQVRRIELGGPEQGQDALSLARRYFNDAKPVAALDDRAWSSVELVITDDACGLQAACGRSLAELSAAFPDTVFGAASVFGLTGPLADAPAVPLDAQAVSSTSWALGEPGRAPLSIPPGVLDCQAGAHLAASCLMARFAGGARAGAGVVDVALADILAAYVAVNCRFYIHHNMQWRRAGRRASNSGGAYPFVILPCADGDVCLSGRTRPEWERFVAAMGSPDWAKEPRYQRLRAMGQQYPEEVDALILPWLERHTKAEIEELANRFQLTIAPLRSFAEVLATPQLAARCFLRPFSDDGRILQGPGLPFKVTPARAPEAPDVAASMLAQAGGKPPLPRGGGGLAGLRVLDLGWVWSAPQTGSILAQFGAEVIKVEHSKRLDNTRLSGPVFRDGQKVEGATT